MDYLNELNQAQQEAVKYLDGPHLIVAGAGSGKTRVLTYKIVHLINNGFSPFNILVLTFTNKAAREMKERIAKLVDAQRVSQLWMGTFHSIFARILRREASLLGFPQNFTIYDTDDAKKLVNEIIKDFMLDTEQYPANEILSRISKAKNNLILPDVYLDNPDIQRIDASHKRPETGLIYKTYMARCKKAGAMDFDDLLLYMNILFKNYPEVLEKYQNLFKYILVDEYQDTNYAQYLIIKKLSMAHGNICVVGDDSQSIYAFRGAKIENIFNFQKDFKNFRLFKLEQNYRSTQNIVNLANRLIENNANRIPKNVFTENHQGEKIKLVEHQSDKAEAYYVAKKIMQIKSAKNYAYSDFAVLYRTNIQSRVFEEALRSYGIPYKLFGSISFFQRAEIKDVTAYLRLLVNKNDDQAIKRIINYPKRGIGQRTIDKLNEYVVKTGETLWDVISNKQTLQKILPASTIVKINSFVNLINKLDELRQQESLGDFIDQMLKRTGILAELAANKTEEGINKFQNVQEFVNAISDYLNKPDENGEPKTLERFLEEIALATDQDTSDADADRVRLMTIHASKGLEFKVVFIVGVEEGMFPSYRSIDSMQALEEERRLFYVAITRCERQLFISYSLKRMKWGKINDSMPSRFIRELKEEFLEIERGQNHKENFGFQAQNTIFAQKHPTEYKSKANVAKMKKVGNSYEKTTETKKVDQTTGIAVGMKVKHQKFGIGKVVKLEGEYPNTKALVDFETVGTKNLLLKFAKLQKLN